MSIDRIIEVLVELECAGVLQLATEVHVREGHHLTIDQGEKRVDLLVTEAGVKPLAEAVSPERAAELILDAERAIADDREWSLHGEDAWDAAREDELIAA